MSKQIISPYDLPTIKKIEKELAHLQDFDFLVDNDLVEYGDVDSGEGYLDQDLIPTEEVNNRIAFLEGLYNSWDIGVVEDDELELAYNSGGYRLDLPVVESHLDTLGDFGFNELMIKFNLI